MKTRHFSFHHLALAVTATLGLGLAQPGKLSARTLYVANGSNDTIEKFTPGGAATQFASSGLSLPTFLAFQVPEPSTWALLCLGAGVFGLTVRRQRRVWLA